jgi:GTP-binding protein
VFLVDDKIYLIDAPGYGYIATVKSNAVAFKTLMDEYFASSTEQLQGVIFLLDSRRVPSLEDADFFNYLQDANIPYLLVMTKTDKLNQKALAQIKKNLLAGLHTHIDQFICTNVNDKVSLKLLEENIAALFVK